MILNRHPASVPGVWSLSFFWRVSHFDMVFPGQRGELPPIFTGRQKPWNTGMSRLKLPIGIQTYSEIRTGGYAYVDKSHFIVALA